MKPGALLFKISAVIVMGALIIVMAVGFSSYTFTKSLMERFIRESQQELAEQTMDKIDRLLYERYLDIQQIAHESLLQNYITQTAGDPSGASEIYRREALKKINEVTTVTGPWDILYFVNREGLIVLSSEEDEIGTKIQDKANGYFAYQAATAGVGAPGFKALLELMRRGNTWMKISGANRVSETDLPPYDDVKPMAHALIAAAPERIMWGTDWPHPNKYVANPNDGDLVDAFGDWVTDPDMRRKIMVDTPAAFYRF